jgi:uncharacterized MnhB-related membrane protein
VLDGVLILLMLLAGIQAIRARPLITSALWLAAASALLSIVLYRTGAQQAAVIELSVGAGLVTVLFVFAISVAGEEAAALRGLVPRPVAWVLVLGSAALLAWSVLPAAPAGLLAAAEAPLSAILWQDRTLDVLAQMVLIFSGVLGLLGLLAEVKPPLQKSAADEVVAHRERELVALAQKVRPPEEEHA